MLTQPHIFPGVTPPGYSYLQEEPRFEPGTDLQLEPPQYRRTLADLGYTPKDQQDYASDLAITGPLRVLSDRGVAKLLEVAGLLSPQVISSAPWAPGVVRGAVYRSRFLRDLSLSPQVADFFSAIGATPLVPTSFPHQLAHLNFPPTDLSRPVQGWHYDENAFVMVLMGHAPAALDGGRFEYFQGTRAEGLALLASGADIPRDRVAVPDFPGAGFAVLMQGSTIVHRAAPLRAPGARLTMVTSYDTREVRHPDPNRMYFVRADLEEDPNARLERYCRYVEYARHKAWRVQGRLSDFLDDVQWTDDPEAVSQMLGGAVGELVEALTSLRRGEVTVEQMLQLRAAGQ